MGFFSFLISGIKQHVKIKDNYDDIDIPEGFENMLNNIPKNDEFNHVGARQQVEFGALPHFLYNESELFIEDILNNKEKALLEIYSIPYDGEELEYPYSIEDFNIDKQDINNDLVMLKLDLPQNNIFIGNCYRVYMIFSITTKEKYYFVVEKSNGDNVLGGISKDGSHLNYGSIKEENEEKKIILSIIM